MFSHGIYFSMFYLTTPSEVQTLESDVSMVSAKGGGQDLFKR